MSQEEKRNESRPEGVPRPQSERSSGPRPQGTARPRSEAGREPARSGARPKRRKRRGMGFGGAILYVVLVIGVSALLAGLAWLAAGDVLALNKPELEAVVTLEESLFTTKEIKDKDGETTTVRVADVDAVADRLQEAGLIDYPLVFKLFAAFTKGERKLAPGTYTLNTDMDYRAIIAGMGPRSLSRATVDVTIPEGFTALQIFQRLEEHGVCEVSKLREAAANYDFKFSFLQNVVPLGDYRRLEGYLFPDTYTFYENDDAVNVLNKMILRFDEKFTDAMRRTVTENGHTIREIVIIASLIEKETTGADQTTISEVIWNRLASENYPKLQIDATVQYILPERKEYLTYDDLAIDDPYNTYLYAGLPAGAIANPGESSIRAAMNPDGSGYYFYALGDDGEHHFFKTYKGQQDFIAKQEYYKVAGHG